MPPKQRKTFSATVATNGHDSIAELEGKLINAAHRKALEAHRRKSMPPIQIARFSA